MIVTIPDQLEARLSPGSAALHLAIGLFVADEATLGQAAEVAGMSQGAFLHELGKRKIPLHYGTEQLAEDLKMVEKLARR
jgi:predicted HTH domain antitoxin